MGTKYLQKMLNEELNRHISEKIPGIKKHLQKHKYEIEKELKKLGAENERLQNPNNECHRLVNLFRKQLIIKIEGGSVGVDEKELQTGSIINHTIYKKVYENIETSRKETKDDEIITTIDN